MSSESIDQAIATAVEHHQAGRLPQAEMIYQQILGDSPDHALALQLLGVLAGQTGQADKAIELISRAIDIVPNVAQFHSNLANVFRETGQFEMAITSYQRAIEINPQFGQAYNNLGNALSDAGRVKEAIAAYSQAIRLNPDDAEAYSNLGIALNDTGDRDCSIAAHRKSIVLNPESAVAWNNLGVALKDNKLFEQAMAAHRKAIELQPGYAEAHNNLGIALQENGQLEEAIQVYNHVIAMKPDYAEAHNNLANALSENDQFDEAIDACRRAIGLKPDYPEAHSNLGTALKETGRFDEAIGAYAKAIHLRPDFAEAHCNLGVALADSGELAKAIHSLQRAIELKPNYAEAHINLGVVLCNTGRADESISASLRAIELAPELEAAHSNFAQILLTLGDYERGWVEYERRWKANPRIRPVPFAEPRWSGEPLNGRTILLHCEQGLGDSIHFVRYAPMIAACGGRVILECQPELVQLFQKVSGVNQVIAAGQTLPAFDVHSPLMSLPLVMRTTLQSVPAQIPYLYARQKKVNNPTSDLNVGLVWAGRSTHSNDRNRSMRLSDFETLSNIPGITFHTLQKGSAAAQALSTPQGMQLIDHSEHIHDFVDTADLISALDLVISVDTSVAHLAGAMGKPVWVLLPYVADWRWLRNRDDSPWYPTMRLFRQSRWGSWNEPLGRMAAFLIDLSKNRTIGVT